MRRAPPLARAGFGRVAVLACLALGAFCADCYSTPRRPDGGEGLLPVGAPAPDLEGFDVGGAPKRLSSFLGHPVVVYFYPHDGTPGCTTEACAFRDAWARFERAHVEVFGVSSQSRESHLAFQRKRHLPFPLVADEDGRVQRAYGVAKGLFGDARVTFLVGPNGRIAHVWPDVDPAAHAGEVLAEATRSETSTTAAAP